MNSNSTFKTQKEETQETIQNKKGHLTSEHLNIGKTYDSVFKVNKHANLKMNF